MNHAPALKTPTVQIAVIPVHVTPKNALYNTSPFAPEGGMLMETELPSTRTMSHTMFFGFGAPRGAYGAGSCSVVERGEFIVDTGESIVDLDERKLSLIHI